MSERQIAAVNKVLSDIGVIEKPTVLALNKTDLLEDERMDVLRRRHPDAFFVSAETGAGMEELLEGLDAELSKLKVEVELEIPFDRGEFVARIHEEGDVLEETYSGEGTRITARLRSESLPDFTKYLISG